jgi:uncharacterized protein YndB with AHSA1/START domain
MTTRKHVHEGIFDADPETVFALLHTPSAIRQWWGASHVIVNPKPGGVWVGLWIVLPTSFMWDVSVGGPTRSRALGGIYRQSTEHGPPKLKASYGRQSR